MISINYDPFAETFSNSRRDLKWLEIEYFLKSKHGGSFGKILDIGCGNGRLIGLLKEHLVIYSDYLGVDSSNILLGEAKNEYPNNKFLLLDMKSIDTINEKFDNIFFIASFHHLHTVAERLDVMKKTFNLLNEGGMVYMTNWSLESEINYMKYINNMIPDSENEFGSKDFEVKIGDYKRFYHSFALEELEYIFEKAGFAIVENREFENKKNIISILKKV